MLINHAQVVFQHKSGLARDEVVNTFTFAKATDWGSGDFAALGVAFNDFFSHVQDGGVSVGSILGPQLSRTELPVIKSYDADGHLSGTAMGSPVNITHLAALPAPLDPNPLPAEVSICLSFNAAYGADFEFAPHERPRQRDRGRIFVGPLIRTVVEIDGTTGRDKPSGSVLASLPQAGARLAAALAPDISWVVWSRKNGTVKPVTQVSIDDAFDTQRRRGERPVVRNLTTLGP